MLQTLAMNTKPNSDIIPSWRGQLIPDAWEDVRYGIEKIRSRIHGHRFVTVVLQRSLDFEGLSEWIYIGWAWSTLEEAQAFASEELDRNVALHVRARNDAEKPWFKYEDLGILRWPDVSIWPTEGPVSRVKWGDGSGYNSEEFLAAIFAVDPTNPMADDLFTALGHETEWISFFQGYAHSR